MLEAVGRAAAVASGRVEPHMAGDIAQKEALKEIRNHPAILGLQVITA